MNRTDKGLIRLCINLEDNALAVLSDDKHYGNMPIESRTTMYEEMRKSVDAVRTRFSHMRGSIGQIKHEYDARGIEEGHKLCERFASHLPEYMTSK